MEMISLKIIDEIFKRYCVNFDKLIDYVFRNNNDFIYEKNLWIINLIDEPYSLIDK